jgi:hypothetical protein
MYSLIDGKIPLTATKVPLFEAKNRADVEIADFGTIQPLVVVSWLDARSVEAAELRTALSRESHAPVASGGHQAPSRCGLTAVRGIAKTGRHAGATDQPVRLVSVSVPSIRKLLASNKGANCRQPDTN